MKEMKTKKTNAKQGILHRVRVLYVIFILIGIIIAARLVWVQAASPSVRHNAEVLNEGVQRMRIVEAHRGAILSRDGEPLALSSLRYHATFDFRSEGIIDEENDEAFAREVDSLSKILAAHFSKENAEKEGYTHITAEEYRTIFHENRRTRKNRSLKIFPRSVTLDEWQMMTKRYPILNYSLGYVYGKEIQNERIYPSEDLAYQLIGRHTDTKMKDGGNYNFGIEKIYNDYLAGKNGEIYEQRIAHGFWTRIDHPDTKLPEDGCNVITTLDANIQKVATERLRETLIAEQASWGVAMVMETATGNILCMASLGSGVERGVEYSEKVYNHALSTPMAPGSTMKLATAMTLLDIGGYTTETIVDTEHASGSKGVKVGAARIYDSHDAGRDTDGKVTLRDGFAHSSNVYFAKAVYDLYKDDPVTYTDHLERLLFNDYVGLQEFGEVKGRLPLADSEEWNTRGSTSTRLPRLAYGYEVEVPPVHTLTFYNGVANGGKMVAPRIVDRIERNGEVVKRMPHKTLIEKMCSESTLEALRECMAAAATPERSSNKFRGLPIDIGIKTGTAQVWTNFVSHSRLDRESMKDGMSRHDEYYLGSVVAAFPHHKPKYTVMVCVTKQRTSTHPYYFGILLSGPVVRDIIDYIYATDPTLHSSIDPAEEPMNPVSIKGGSTRAVTTVSKELLDDVTPAEEPSEWSTAKVEEGVATLSSRAIGDGMVPNVVGMGLSDALYVLERAGLSVTHAGSGRVVSQSLRAGTATGEYKQSIHLLLER